MGKMNNAGSLREEEKYPLLCRIDTPEDLRALPETELPALAREIRAFLLEKIPVSGGHLASNLGVVELTLALHRIFDTPNDRIIFDVGHQSYVHKLLTGRRREFDTLRTPGGLSGFTRRAESEYDPFGAGHSSTSLSAALGFAYADRMEGKDNFTVAVVGDGAYTGGMIHEALNNVERDMRLIVVLNENEMSISRNIGGFARYIARIRNSRNYRRAKKLTITALRHLPLIGRPLFRLFRGIKQMLKNHLYSSNYFEELGLYYFGPVDGNDYEAVSYLLQKAKEQNESVILHIRTQKGKGYAPAEERPDIYHSVYTGYTAGETFPETAGETLLSLAEEDPHVVAVTAAMREGTGLSEFFRRFPGRAFDVGIAEEHALTFAAGLAAAGEKPYVAVYSTFLQRAYDSLIHDIALQGLPVRILVDRAGLAGADGPTHHGIFDVSFLSVIPGMTLYAPATRAGLRAVLRDTQDAASPVAVRYENRTDIPEVLSRFYPEGDFSAYGVRPDYRTPEEACDGVILTYGAIISEALSAAAVLRAEGKKIGVLLLEMLAPYDALAARVQPLLPKGAPLLFLEEGVYDGGAGMLLYDRLRERGVDGRMRVLAIRGNFACPDTPVPLRSYCHIAAEDVIAFFRDREKAESVL